MNTIVFNPNESTSRTQTHTFTIDDLVSVESVSVNTGSVSVVSVVDDVVTLSCVNGAYTRQVLAGGSYTPADSKTVTNTISQSFSYEIYWSSYKYFLRVYPPSPSSGISYNSGGYSGTLNITNPMALEDQVVSILNNINNSYDYDDGIKTGSTSAVFSYSGTVTKPASDTRYYTYYYQYIITINYIIKSFPDLQIKINGELKVSDMGWVKINGELKQISTITIKDNGVLKEV